MIKSFRCDDTAKLAAGVRVRKFIAIERVAQRKLDILQAAINFLDLKIPPAKRLEKLAGDRNGQYSIRVNDQGRICFEWKDGHAHQVEIVDYH